MQEIEQLRKLSLEREHQLSTEQKAFQLQKLTFMQRVTDQEKFSQEERQGLQLQIDQLKKTSEEKVIILQKENRALEVHCLSNRCFM